MRVYAWLQGKHPTESTPASAADNGELKCMGTGMDVACSDDVNGLPQQTSPETLQAASGLPTLTSSQLITCSVPIIMQQGLVRGRVRT